MIILSRIIDKGLEEQTVLLVRMGELTLETLDVAIHGYLEGKSVKYRVQENSDLLIAMSQKVEDLTFELIARYQPVAIDLRTIKSYMKIGNDFARYGRYSLDISIINDQFKSLPRCDKWVQSYLEEMGHKVLTMVKTSVDALKRCDIELAKSISQSEREIDKMYRELLRELISKRVNNRCVMSSTLMSRYLERIADHSVYVCESIVYMVTGEKLTLD
jgi:phosphate transport system protein